MSKLRYHDCIQFGETWVEYQIRHSKEKKSLAITISKDGVIVTAPTGMCSAAIRPWVLKKSAWIVTKLDETKHQKIGRSLRFESGESIFYLGRQFKLKVTSCADKKSSRLKLLAGVFHLTLPINEAPDERLRVGRKLFYQWYQKQLIPRLANPVQRYAKLLKLEVPSYKVMNLRGRWGSCHADKGLRFHWKLASVSPLLIDFVVAHEVCHLVHPLHDTSFSHALDRIIPNWKTLENQLSSYIWVD